MPVAHSSLRRSLITFIGPSLLLSLFLYTYHAGYLPNCPPEIPALLLLFGMPIFFYTCVVRPQRWPLLTVGSMWGLAAGISYWLLPPSRYPWLHWTGYMAGGLEIFALGYLAWNVRAIARNYRTARANEPDFLTALECAVKPVAGRATAPLLAELALMRYALWGNWATPEVSPETRAFDYHRESGFGALMIVAVGLLIVEAGAVHLILHRWSPLAAGLWLVLDIYALLWLLAHRQAARLRPVLVSATAITIRVGFVWYLHIPRAALARVDFLTDTPARLPDLLNAAKPLLATPNILLTFTHPLSAQGAYGIHRLVKQTAIYVDDYKDFFNYLQPVILPELEVFS